MTGGFMSIKKCVFALSLVLGCLVVAAADEDTPGAHVEDAAVVSKDWKFDALVIGGKDQKDKSVYSGQDTVYLNAGTEEGLVPGSRCEVYHKGDAMKDPQTGKLLGYDLKRIGMLEITEADKHSASGLIVDSKDTIEVGDTVKRVASE
jgi:hypothetical protein